MRYLLDTHVFLWYFDGSDKLSETAKNILDDADIQKYISVASLWEFAIKFGIGKIKFEGGLEQLWNIVMKNGFHILPIDQPHIKGVIGLPFIHRDPFDRLLIAIAKAENMTILSADENIRKYGVTCLW